MSEVDQPSIIAATQAYIKFQNPGTLNKAEDQATKDERSYIEEYEIGSRAPSFQENAQYNGSYITVRPECKVKYLLDDGATTGYLSEIRPKKRVENPLIKVKLGDDNTGEFILVLEKSRSN
ncbi:hypothetical protein PHMEG_00021265 [Phytophthora megakarya]|uniref:Uncharacterized protein n=1 Tax=Phytophthora megakarya TaxID=4795 RepID=A0A225VNZ8_9STRA|nr:hypothetical protein PHMEG_00021265 [Phytophthora megakarya]